MFVFPLEQPWICGLRWDEAGKTVRISVARQHLILIDSHSGKPLQRDLYSQYADMIV